jgi:hypothetical protein
MTAVDQPNRRTPFIAVYWPKQPPASSRRPICRSPSKESRTTQIGNPKPEENRHAHPAFLQNRLLAQGQIIAIDQSLPHGLLRRETSGLGGGALGLLEAQVFHRLQLFKIIP